MFGEFGSPENFFQGVSSLFIITVSRRDREIGLKYSDAQ